MSGSQPPRSPLRLLMVLGFAVRAEAMPGAQAPRSPLRLSLSADNGATWDLSADIASGAGEYSYPAVVATAGGGALLSFTWQRSRIAVVALSAGDLRGAGEGGLFAPTPGTEGPGSAPTYSLEHFVNTVGERT